MRKILAVKLKVLKANIKSVIIFSAVYLISIILGAIFIKIDCYQTLYFNARNYYVAITGVSHSVFKIFLNCILVGAFLTVAVICFGFSKFTVPLVCVILFYRGIVLGSCAVLFFWLYGIGGIFIFIIITLPTNILITAGLIVASVLNYQDFSCFSGGDRWKIVVKNAIISLIFSLVSAMYLLFVVGLIIRPINYLF